MYGAGKINNFFNCCLYTFKDHSKLPVNLSRYTIARKSFENSNRTLFPYIISQLAVHTSPALSTHSAFNNLLPAQQDQRSSQTKTRQKPNARNNVNGLHPALGSLGARTQHAADQMEHKTFHFRHHHHNTVR